MTRARNVALVAAVLGSLTAATATQSAFAQTNRYTRVQAGTSYLGPNGLVDRGFGGPIGGFGLAPAYGQGHVVDQGDEAFGGPGSFFGGY